MNEVFHITIDNTVATFPSPPIPADFYDETGKFIGTRDVVLIGHVEEQEAHVSA